MADRYNSGWLGDQLAKVMAKFIHPVVCVAYLWLAPANGIKPCCSGPRTYHTNSRNEREVVSYHSLPYLTTGLSLQ